MRRITFTVEGVDGEFACDADEIRNYRTIKQIARLESDPAGFFSALERIYMGMDEEYVERVGGFEHIGSLNDAAALAAGSKNSLASSDASSGTETK